MRHDLLPRPWHWSHAAIGPTRLLVETPDPALLVSELRRFEDAGFEVSVCPGPTADAGSCPLLRGAPCPTVAAADVVLQGPGQGTELASAIRRLHPRVAVVVEQRQPPAPPGAAPPGAAAPDAAAPDGWVALSFPCSIDRQIDVVRRAATGRLPQRSTADRSVTTAPAAPAG